MPKDVFPKSISSLVISESRGPVSAVFCGNEWFPMMCGLCNTFLKCAFQLLPVIPSIKVRSFFLCSSLPNNFQNSFVFLLLHFIFWSIVSLCANLFFLTVFFREVFCLDKRIFSSSLLGSLLIFFLRAVISFFKFEQFLSNHGGMFFEWVFEPGIRLILDFSAISVKQFVARFPYQTIRNCAAHFLRGCLL